MLTHRIVRAVAVAAVLGGSASTALAQAPATPTTPTICGASVPPPANLPPAGSGPVIYLIAPCFPAQGNAPNVDAQTYLYYMELAKKPSQPSQNIWVPWNAQAEQTAVADHKRLWATGFLSDLSIEATDYTFSNGVIGKLVTYNMEERERVKIVNYEGSKQIDRAKIDEQLRARSIELRLDSFLDNGTIRRIETVLREMMAEKGFTNAQVSHTVTAVAGGPKLVNVTFTVGEGPKIKIRSIDFVGNVAKADGTLKRKMKDNKTPGIFGLIMRGGTYQEAKFESDADLIQSYYRNEGYVQAQIGQPELKVLENSKDGKTRWVQLVIPVTEGERYRVGSFSVDGNTVVRSEALMPLFKVKVGDWYNEKEVRDGLVKAREMYGAGGYMEFTGFPDIKPSDDANAAVPDALAAPEPEGPPTVEVTMRLQEGKQYLVNRITFVGNTTTRDNVIRREMRLIEGSVFNTEALKYSVRRLNQLGYFETDQRAGSAGDEGRQDAGSRRHGRRDHDAQGTESQPAHVRRGGLPIRGYVWSARIPDRQLPGTRREPHPVAAGWQPRPELSGRVYRAVPLRPEHHRWLRHLQTLASVRRLLHAGVHRRQRHLRFPARRLQPDVRQLLVRTGEDERPQRGAHRRVVHGRRAWLFDHLLTERSVPVVRPPSSRCCAEIHLSTIHCSSARVAVGQSARWCRVSCTTPWTIRSSRTPASGTRRQSTWRCSAATRISSNPAWKGSGSFAIRREPPSASGRSFSTSRRPEAPSALPIFERLFEGGEYSVRGYDIRSIGPTVPGSLVVLGGNKSLLFNAEYMISIASQVRLIFFYDAGQVRDVGDSFSWMQELTTTVHPPPPVLFDPLGSGFPQRS